MPPERTDAYLAAAKAHKEIARILKQAAKEAGASGDIFLKKAALGHAREALKAAQTYERARVRTRNRQSG